MKWFKKIYWRFQPFISAFFPFVLLSLIGAILLLLPFSVSRGKHLNFIDAFFTSTSAICVTGLVVVDTGSTFRWFGELVIALLIQIGGLGYMTLSATFLLVLRKTLDIKTKKSLQEAMGIFTLSDVIPVLKRAVKFTFLMEGIGFILLFLKFIQFLPFKQALRFSAFHSISAFCNAGFDLFGERYGEFCSIQPFSKDTYLILITAFLFISGGLGFIVVSDAIVNFKEVFGFKGLKYIFYNLKRFFEVIYKGEFFKFLKDFWDRLNIHSKIVFRVTFVLLFIGTIGVLVFEWGNKWTIGSMGFGYKLLNAFFHSATPRTAGFSTLNVSKFSYPTLILTIFLMFIGASPGGTGGGIKTTTFAVVLYYLKIAIMGKEEIVIYKRSIGQRIVKQSLAIFIYALSAIFISTFLVSISMQNSLYFNRLHFPFLTILFEVFSAFGTVGLSMGITPYLNAFSKFIIIITMFLGRLGSTTLAMWIAIRTRKSFVHYPETEIVVG